MQENIDLQGTWGVLWPLIAPGSLFHLILSNVEKGVEKKTPHLEDCWDWYIKPVPMYFEFINEMYWNKGRTFFLSAMLIITFPFPAVLLFINNNMFIYSSFHLRMLAATCSKHLSLLYDSDILFFCSGRKEMMNWSSWFFLTCGMGTVLFLLVK